MTKKTTTPRILADINKEITGRKRAEKKLRERTAELLEREADLAITLRSIGDAMIATDTEGRVMRMNPVAEQLTGWSLAEAAGKPLEDIFHIINTRLVSSSGDCAGIRRVHNGGARTRRGERFSGLFPGADAGCSLSAGQSSPNPGM